MCSIAMQQMNNNCYFHLFFKLEILVMQVYPLGVLFAIYNIIWNPPW